MSLYPNTEYSTTTVYVKTYPDGGVNLVFFTDGGKFGTHETLDEYDITASELLDLLQNKL